MKATKTLMVAALAAAGLGMATLAEAQAKHAGHGYRGGGHHHGGHRHWGPRHYWGWSIGVPLAIGSAWSWGYPHYYWDSPRVVYREVVRDEGYIGHVRPLPGEAGIRYEGEARPEPQPQPAPRAQPAQEGAPATGPLYMNYCESSRAYYPKVTSCPEGWKFQQPAR